MTLDIEGVVDGGVSRQEALGRTGEVGSVGVVAVHIDESGADAMAGLNWTLIHAGARKTDGNPHEPLSPRARADMQADVDALYDELVAVVAANRGISTEAVRATEAAIYRGEKAVRAGLVDRVGTIAQATPIWRRRCRRSASAPARKGADPRIKSGGLFASLHHHQGPKP